MNGSEELKSPVVKEIAKLNVRMDKLIENLKLGSSTGDLSTIASIKQTIEEILQSNVTAEAEIKSLLRLVSELISLISNKSHSRHETTSKEIISTVLMRYHSYIMMMITMLVVTICFLAALVAYKS